jgi:hypothetical protein
MRETWQAKAKDECEESQAVVKTYWSLQGVDTPLERRRAMAASLGRLNTEVGMSGIRAGPSWGRHRHDEQGGCVVM